MDHLTRRLKEVGPAAWEAIAADCGIAKSLPRKIVYDKERNNFGIQKLQPLLDFFGQVDRGEKNVADLTEKQGA